jgi:transcriptional regulator with XRE-family HTH domain
MNSLDVPSAIRRARQARKWSQQALAERAGLPQSHIAKLESGCDVRSSTLLRVASALGLNVELRPSLRDVFERPPLGSKLAAAQEWGVDIGQLFAAHEMSPKERLELAAESCNGMARLFA